MSNKQTAVEWLIDQLRQLAHNQSTHLGMGDIRVTQGMLDEFEEQAKEMEKQQKIDFARHCLDKANRTFDLDILTSFIDVHQYYNETFGGNK